MKLNEIVIEMVQRITPFKLEQLESIRENKKIFKNITQYSPKAKIVQTFETGIKLYQLDKGRETEFYGIDDEEQLVAYYMRFEIQNSDFVDVDWVTQVMVWRGHLTANKTKALAEKVFYDFVLDKFGVAVSDGEQSPDGERFWKQRIIEAFANPTLKVYILNFHEKKCKRLLKTEYIKVLNTPNDPWGNTAWHKGVRLAISDFDLIQE